MKKFVKSFLMAAAALVLFAGCSNLSNATVSGNPEKAVIQIGIDNSVDYGTKSARTINPEAIASNAAPDTFGKITLKGESEKGNKIDEYTLSFSSGKAEVELSYDVWYLTMSAYSKNDPTLKILEGRRRLDMKNGAPASNEAVTFKLSSEGVTTVGKVKLAGTFTDNTTTPLASKYKAALYDLNTNAVIEGTEKSGECSGENVGKFSYEVTNVEPGRYNFRIYFYMTKGTGDSAKDVAIGTWGDIIVIAPGRETKNEELALGDILNKAPDAPEGLAAYYVDGSADGNNYNVFISWQDKSNNEEYFELTIQNCDGSSPVNYKIFGAETDEETVHVKEVFWESDIRVDGTLSAGSKSCIVKLPLAKKFDISIKAVNVVGESSSCSRETDTTKISELSGKTAYGTEKINLIKIVYDLNGGMIKSTNKTGSLTEYHIFKDEDITLTTFTDLEMNHHPFLQWNDPEITTGDKKITKISVFGNKTVEASYNTKSIINYEINDSYGTITASATQGSDNVKNGVLKSNGNVDFAISGTDAADVTHILVRFLSVDGKDITQEADGSNLTFKRINELASGTYTVQVIATKKDGKQYSDVFAITKEL